MLGNRNGGPTRLYRLVRRPWLPGNQFGPVMIHDGQELLIVNVPKGPLRLVLAQESKMGDELAKPDVWGHLTQFS
jgi:hypothetical protein